MKLQTIDKISMKVSHTEQSIKHLIYIERSKQRFIRDIFRKNGYL